jgi:hypothetical protein
MSLVAWIETQIGVLVRSVDLEERRKSPDDRLVRQIYHLIEMLRHNLEEILAEESQ